MRSTKGDISARTKICSSCGRPNNTLLSRCRYCGATSFNEVADKVHDINLHATVRMGIKQGLGKSPSLTEMPSIKGTTTTTSTSLKKKKVNFGDLPARRSDIGPGSRGFDGRGNVLPDFVSKYGKQKAPKSNRSKSPMLRLIEGVEEPEFLKRNEKMFSDSNKKKKKRLLRVESVPVFRVSNGGRYANPSVFDLGIRFAESPEKKGIERDVHSEGSSNDGDISDSNSPVYFEDVNIEKMLPSPLERDEGSIHAAFADIDKKIDDIKADLNIVKGEKEEAPEGTKSPPSFHGLDEEFGGVESDEDKSSLIRTSSVEFASVDRLPRSSSRGSISDDRRGFADSMEKINEIADTKLDENNCAEIFRSTRKLAKLLQKHIEANDSEMQKIETELQIVSKKVVEPEDIGSVYQKRYRKMQALGCEDQLIQMSKTLRAELFSYINMIEDLEGKAE